MAARVGSGVTARRPTAWNVALVLAAVFWVGPLVLFASGEVVSGEVVDAREQPQDLESTTQQRPLEPGRHIGKRCPKVDDVEIHFRCDQFVLVFRSHREKVAARIDEVGGPIEATDIPRRLGSDSIAARHEVAVGDGVCRLLEFPQVL